MGELVPLLPTSLRRRSLHSHMTFQVVLSIFAKVEGKGMFYKTVC